VPRRTSCPSIPTVRTRRTRTRTRTRLVGSALAPVVGVGLVCAPAAASGLVTAGAAAGSVQSGPQTWLPSMLTARSAPTWAGREVTYRGLRLRVPVGWPVVNLESDPSACARLDVHALYLGRQGAAARCPGHLVGRTEAVQVQPVGSADGPFLAATVGTLHGESMLLRAATGTSNEIDLLLPRLGLRLTSSYSGDPALAAQVAGSATPVLPAAAVSPPRPVPSGTRSRTAARTPAPAAGAGTEAVGAPTATARTASAPALAAQTAVYTGPGFDTCSAPSTGSMSAWLASPYRSIGIYVGGANRACGDGNLSPSWVSTVVGQGFRLAPLYVGLQAPCVFQGGLATIPTGDPAGAGAAAADDAVVRAQSFGIGAGNPVYFDMEGYDDSQSACVATVDAFLRSWTAELHRRGYLSGLYSSAASGIRDQAAMTGRPGYTVPDDVWIADWNGVAGVFGDPYVGDGYWSNHQRLHQYQGDHLETYGGVTIDIDSDYDDGAVVGGPLPPPDPGASPALASPTSGRLDVFYPSRGGLEQGTWITGYRLWTANPLGGGVLNGPAAVSPSPGTLATFVRGISGGLYVKYAGSGGSVWSSWQGLGGVLTARPAAVASAGGRLDVFVRGTDGGVWWRTRSAGGGWGPWISLGGGLASGTGPAAASAASGSLTVAVNGTDGALWIRTYAGGRWSGWVSVGGAVRSDPALVQVGSGALEAFVRGSNDSLYLRPYSSSSGWGGWTNLGGALSGGPAAATGMAAGRLDVFVPGVNGALYQRVLAGGWSPWIKITP